MDADDAREAMDRSLGQLLLKAARLLDERAIARVNADPRRPPGVELRPAHTRLFPHIPFEGGIRTTDLAKTLGVTKQAVQPLIAELEAWEIVVQVPDPSDGRARLVRWTPAGIAAIQHGLAVLLGIEAEIAADLGPRRTDELRDALRRVVAILER